jgi:hypothetical protein
MGAGNDRLLDIYGAINIKVVEFCNEAIYLKKDFSNF